jgi:uncharacterized protein YqjF (DUF2071 family)
MPLSMRHPVMRMRWRHLLFLHWPIEAKLLRGLVPPHLEIDEFDGMAWVGLVPFAMEDVSPRGLPRVPLRGITDFHECNVRTYVYPRGKRDDAASHGVWFFSLDAASRLAVWGARKFFHLPYFNARIGLHRSGDGVEYSLDRIDAPGAAMRCRWRALESLPPSQPGELAHFLTERYCLYAANGENLYRGRIAHDPWPLRKAEVLSIDDSLVRAAGIEVDPAVKPIAFHADRLDVRAWLLAPVERGDLPAA